MLKARRLAVIVTLKCTLKCKLCCNYATRYTNAPIVDKQEILDDIKEVFRLYDEVEWLQFVGGELFLHPNLDEILSRAFDYADQFDKIILMTNATLLPGKKTLEVMAAHKERFKILISDYGKLSCKREQLEAVLAQHDIPYDTRVFYGDMQHYGGWVDPGDFSDRGYSDEQIKAAFESCWQIGLSNLHLYRGKIHNCIKSLFALDLKEVVIPNNEYVDLRDRSLTLEQKREIAASFNTRPLTACKFCNGFDTNNSDRFPAAEQAEGLAEIGGRYGSEL